MPPFPPNPHDHASTRRRSAFTLTELLVVLAVVALLVSIRLPALARVKTQTWIVQCSGNLRQVTLSILLYGTENNGRLYSGNTGFWPWDLPDPLYKSFSLYSGSLASNIYYCPSMPYQASLWNYEGSAHITSYAYTFPGAGGGGDSFTGSYATNVNYSTTQQQIQLNAPGNPVVVPIASKRPLTVDAEICAGPYYDPTLPVSSYNFTDITGGASAFPDGRHHRASHLAGKYPLGGNLGMLDGHVEWRAIRSSSYKMIQRNAAQPPNGTPCFLW